MSHGGKRAGAGRKPVPADERKQAYTTKLSQEVVAYLRDQKNAAATIEQTIRRSKDFRQWAKS